MAGIANVGTLKEERGKGYMGKIMRYALKKIEDEGFQVSMLSARNFELEPIYFQWEVYNFYVDKLDIEDIVSLDISI